MTQAAEELLQQSRADKVRWEVVEGRKHAYKVAYPDTTVIISSWSLPRDVARDPISDLATSLNLGVSTYRMELLDSTGEVDEALLAIPGQAVHKTCGMSTTWPTGRPARPRKTSTNCWST